MPNRCSVAETAPVAVASDERLSLLLEFYDFALSFASFSNYQNGYISSSSLTSPELRMLHRVGWTR
jgi:hypothetical protein